MVTPIQEIQTAPSVDSVSFIRFECQWIGNYSILLASALSDFRSTSLK